MTAVKVGGGGSNPIEAPGGSAATDDWATEIVGVEIPEACSGGKYWYVNPEPVPE
jgi:hypothetical protein